MGTFLPQKRRHDPSKTCNTSHQDLTYQLAFNIRRAISQSDCSDTCGSQSGRVHRLTPTDLAPLQILRFDVSTPLAYLIEITSTISHKNKKKPEEYHKTPLDPLGSCEHLASQRISSNKCHSIIRKLEIRT